MLIHSKWVSVLSLSERDFLTVVICLLFSQKNGHDVGCEKLGVNYNENLR